MIKVKDLRKEFVKYEKEKGLKGMIKGIFNAKKVVKEAVKGINFEIEEGEIVGYIGANGAGKSTTIKMLTGILYPTSGEILIDGMVPFDDRIKYTKEIGVVFGQRTQLWWDLPLVETYLILKEIYEVSDKDYDERMKFFNEVLEIDSFIKSPVRTLSLGQRMRADIAASLLHNPKILYLDEPTIGLDVMAKSRMRDAIKLMNDKFNTTVILTTHDLDDIEELCRRIIMIDEGEIIFDGSIDQIRSNHGDLKTISYVIKNLETISEKSIGKEFEGVEVKKDNSKLHITFDKDKISLAEVTRYMMNNYEIEDMSVKDIGIEEIVKKIYERGEI